MAGIHFFTEDISFRLQNSLQLKRWIKQTIVTETHQLQELNFIFCSDEYLLEINKTYLNHDYYTDIITFDNSEKERAILGDIFISIDRITDNASHLHVPFNRELHRVMIHGVLHLLGYQDKLATNKKMMTAKEDQYLAVFYQTN